MTKSRGFALIWLLGFTGVATLIGQFHATSIQNHHLPDTLKWGFDAFGRNCLGLTFVAAYQSLQLLIPMVTSLILISLLASFIAFFSGEWFRFLFRSALDLLSSLPGLLIALAISAFFENRSGAFILACTISIVPYLMRFYEGQVSILRSQPYYQSIIAVGANPVYLYLRYVVPELLSSTVSVFPFLMTRLILIETSLSFLGIQAFTHGETWGRLLYQGKDYLLEAPWILGCVATPLFLTLLSFHLLSDPERH